MIQSECEKSKRMKNSLAFSCKPIWQRFGLRGLQKKVVEPRKTEVPRTNLLSKCILQAQYCLPLVIQGIVFTPLWNRLTAASASSAKEGYFGQVYED